MKVLCCLDGTNTAEIGSVLKSMLPPDQVTLGLIYVIDSGPHGEMERSRERFLRPAALDPRRRSEIQDAENSAAQDILQEAAHDLGDGQKVQRTGRPEREIVEFAVEWKAELIVISARSPRGGSPSIGPKSVGHVARFVLDHAPCPVLLVRPLQSVTLPPPPPR